METKGNYFLIGLFTLLGFLGILGFLAWFSKVELDRQFAYYDVYFPNVSGLDRASTVKFAGLGVGQVVDLSLAESGDGTVRVRLEVEAATPVRTDSEATIEAQGVTGVSYVGISAGSPVQPLLANTVDRETPVITAGRSTLQTLTEDAPRVIDRTLETLEHINDLFSPENRALVDEILANLGSASADLDQTLSNFSQVAEDVGASVGEIASFTGELEGISGSVDSTLELAAKALETIDDFATKATETLDAGTQMLTSADETVVQAGAFIDNELAAMVTDLTETSATLRLRAEELSDDAAGFMTTWSETGSEATTRLVQLEDLIKQTSVMVYDLSTTLDTIDVAAASFDTLISHDGALLVAEARNTIEAADRALIPLAEAAENDLPGILEDLRNAAQTVEETVALVGEDVSAASGRIDGLSASAETALAEISETFAQARGTLTGIDEALSVAEGTLTAAESAFTGADRVINDEIDTIVADLRGTVERANRALDQVSADLPAVTADLRRAAGDASALVAGARGPVQSFVDGGLPQYTQLANEARQLVDLMERLVARIERDPARFITGGSTPEYRRR